MKPSYLDSKKEKKLHIYWLLITQANPFPYQKTSVLFNFAISGIFWT